MLADYEIEAAHNARRDGRDRYVGLYRHLSIAPYSRSHLNPASYDVTLSPVVRVFKHTSEPIDVADVQEGHTSRLDMREAKGRFVLSPGDFILGATSEVITLPETLVARVEGKSSLGRLGLVVHSTAGFIDPGFSGSITLEIANLSPRPVVLRMGMRIAQIAFTPMNAAPLKSYAQTGRYQGQEPGEPVESRYTMDRHPLVGIEEALRG